MPGFPTEEYFALFLYGEQEKKKRSDQFLMSTEWYWCFIV